MREVLQTAGVSSLYVADSPKGREAGSVLFGQWGLSPTTVPLESRSDCASLAESLAGGGNSLVICPPGLVPDLLEALKAPATGAPRPEDLYSVVRRPGGVELERSKFGFLATGERLSVEGPVNERYDLSAVAVFGNDLIVGADEQASVQVLESNLSGSAYRAGAIWALTAEGEVDIEGLALRRRELFVLGSHSLRRRNVDFRGDKSWSRGYSKNRKRFLASEIRRESSRDRIYRMTLTEEGKPSQLSSINLRELLVNHPILSPYASLPSKENGIDIEGLACHGERLYLGFRGPIFRSGFVPVLRLRYHAPEDNELSFVNLAGRGIRDLVEVDDGFLMLAGPVGDSTLSYQLYHWDGLDCLPGRRAEGAEATGRVTLLGNIPTPSGGKAEGLAVLEASPESYRVLVVFDGVEDGAMTVFEVPRL